MSKWQIKKILLFHGLIGILLISFFLPKIPGIWELLDVKIFRFFNSFLLTSPALRTFLALANNRLADLLEDLCIMGFYLIAIFRIPKEKRIKRSCELIFCVLLTACTILAINRLLFRDLFPLRRKSPTLVLNDAILVSDYFSWISIKKSSTKSFPGDHATTAFMFACTYAWYVRGRLALLAFIYAGFLCIPRLAVGAHWLSDIIVGSGSIVLFSLTWAFFTPFGDHCTQGLQKFLLRWKFKKNSHLA